MIEIVSNSRFDETNRESGKLSEYSKSTRYCLIIVTRNHWWHIWHLLGLLACAPIKVVCDSPNTNHLWKNSRIFYRNRWLRNLLLYVFVSHFVLKSTRKCQINCPHSVSHNILGLVGLNWRKLPASWRWGHLFGLDTVDHLRKGVSIFQLLLAFLSLTNA